MLNFSPSIEQLMQAAMQQHQAGALPQAEAFYRQVLQQDPRHVQALNLLGVLALQTKRHDVGVDLLTRAIAIEPAFAEAHCNLGLALQDQGRLDEAIAAYRRAIAIKPDFPEAWGNLGVALRNRGLWEEAIGACRQAIALRPNDAEGHYNLGNALAARGRRQDAIAAYRQAIALKPDHAEAHNNLGSLIQKQGGLDEALATFRRAIALSPNNAEAHNNLGNVLGDLGRLDESLAAYRQALTLKPDYALAHSNLVYAMHFLPASDVTALAREHREWNRRHAQPLTKHITPHVNEPDPHRRLRIGYVSPDLREHAVGRFLLPLLASHDKSQVEVFAYAQVGVPDATTGQLQACCDSWRSLVGLSDSQAADLIRQDGIDILVDLTMHMADNRLLIFARKPAPVQVTYLAYCSSTGLETMDYRLSDPWLDPPGEGSWYCEQTVYLPETYWCYQPSPATPEVGALPAVSRGLVTFGCLNNFYKVNEGVVAAWVEILRRVARSKLVLLSHQGSHRQRMLERMGREGIEPGRVRFVTMAALVEYLRRYESIDIALDTFPYGGGTTSCDALWMGAPVVSLVGKTGVGRGGLSILSNIGLKELAVDSVEEYVRAAAGLAGDLRRLAELRGTLRGRMEKSPLMDSARFARNVEAAYRQMWRARCATRR